MKKLFLSLSALAFIMLNLFQHLHAQNDGTSCNKAIILPAPAEVCSGSQEHVIKSSEVWLKFTANSDKAKIILSPSSVQPDAQLTKLQVREGNCSNPVVLKEISVTGNSADMEVTGLTSGNTYFVKAERSASSPDANFKMCVEKGGNIPPPSPLCGASVALPPCGWEYFSSTTNFLFKAPNGMQTIFMNDAGKVGIGTTSPYKRLTVNGDVSFANYNTSGGGNSGDGFSGLEILGMDQVPTRRGISLDPDPNGSLNFYVHTFQTPSAFNFKDGSNGNTLMTIDAKSGNATLRGELYACKVVVEILSGCDFVLNDNYNLLPLKKRKEIVLKNKFLPNVKPAKDMETKGADLGNTTMGILQNVEEHELFLYNHDERIEKLEKEKEEQKALINKLIKELEEMKKIQTKK